MNFIIKALIASIVVLSLSVAHVRAAANTLPPKYIQVASASYTAPTAGWYVIQVASPSTCTITLPDAATSTKGSGTVIDVVNYSGSSVTVMGSGKDFAPAIPMNSWGVQRFIPTVNYDGYGSHGWLLSAQGFDQGLQRSDSPQFQSLSISGGLTVSNGAATVPVLRITQAEDIQLKAGLNCSMGAGALSSGFCYVPNQWVSSVSEVFVTDTTAANPISVQVTTGGFTVTGSGSDKFNWLLINPLP